MKLSKSLLKAIAIGVTIGSTTACVGTLQDIEDPVQEEQSENESNIYEEKPHHWDDCIDCGMG